jgi:hypothetical protein
MRRIRRRTLFLAALALLALAGRPVAAQDVQYTTFSKADLGGFINAIAKLGGGLETNETTYIKGGRMRTDTEGASTIMDFAAGRYIWIDHKAKTYTVVTVEQMVAMANQAAAQVRASGEVDARGGEDSTTLHGDSGEVKLEFKLAVDRTNESQTINGWGAKRSFITMTTDATVKVEGEQEEQEAGSLVVFVDMWSSTDVPVYTATQRLQENTAARAYLEDAGNAAQGIGSAFAGDPQMSAALRQAGEEMQKIEGAAVRTTTYVVGVPPTIQFDKDLVLNPKKESAAKRIGGSALRGALGRLGGGQRQQEPAAEEAPQQKTVFSFTSEIRDAKAANLPDSLFEPPSGYRQVEPSTGS